MRWARALAFSSLGNFPSAVVASYKALPYQMPYRHQVYNLAPFNSCCRYPFFLWNLETHKNLIADACLFQLLPQLDRYPRYTFFIATSN